MHNKGAVAEAARSKKKRKMPKIYNRVSTVKASEKFSHI